MNIKIKSNIKMVGGRGKDGYKGLLSQWQAGGARAHLFQVASTLSALSRRHPISLPFIAGTTANLRNTRFKLPSSYLVCKAL